MRISPANVGAFLASAVTAQAAAAAAGLLLVRWMPVQDYALYTICVTMIGAITLLTRGGVRLGLAAALAKAWPDRAAAAEGVNAANRVRLMISVLTIPPILSLAWVLLDRAGASVSVALAVLAILLAIWLADTLGAVIDQVLFFDRKAPRLQALDSAIAGLRLGLVGLLGMAGAVSMLATLLTNLGQSVVRIPALRRWVAQSLDGQQCRASSEQVSAVRRIALRQLPVDLFVALQTQATIFYLTRSSGGLELATYGAVARVAQVLAPFNAMIFAYFVPHFATATEQIARRVLGYVAIGALPGLTLFVVALLVPQGLLYFIGPAYAEQRWALLACTGMVAVVSALDVAVNLTAHRGWNRWGWVRIAIGLAWIALAPGIIAVDTAAGAYLFYCGFSIGAAVALVLELRSASQTGEISLRHAVPAGG